MCERSKPSTEQLAAAQAAMVTVDVARANIERYLRFYAGSNETHTQQPLSHGTKGAEDAGVGLTKIVLDSAKLAAATLEEFVRMNRDN